MSTRSVSRIGFVELKADIASIMALAISLCAAGYQLYWFFHGPHLRLYPPEQVFMNHDVRDGRPNNVRFTARMAYINEAITGYADTIVHERIIFTINGESYTHHWQQYVSFKPGTGDDWFNIEDDAHPAVIGGGSAVSHETWFHPRARRCPVATCDPSTKEHVRDYLKWPEFVRKLEKADKISFRFEADTASGEVLAASCVADVDDRFRELIHKNRWHAPACHQE